jgi:hypothetical protein
VVVDGLDPAVPEAPALRPVVVTGGTGTWLPGVSFKGAGAGSGTAVGASWTVASVVPLDASN